MSIFDSELFSFLRDLRENNDRDWFAAHKERYETHVFEPAMAFIRDIEPKLQDISPHITAVAKRQGGSMFRIYRDTRFSKDKSPYKDHVGLQFRHAETTRDVHAPGFYLHLAPDDVSVGAGMWQPSSAALASLRQHVVDEAGAWSKVRKALTSADLSFMGQSLKRAPKGFDADHEHVEDLKRKDWAVHRPLGEAAITADDAVDRVAAAFAQASPLMDFLCKAQGLPF